MVSLILAPEAPRNFIVNNAASRQLSLSWEAPNITNGQILLYQYCYKKVHNSNQICGNTIDNSTKSLNITNLGKCFSLSFIMNARFGDMNNRETEVESTLLP